MTFNSIWRFALALGLFAAPASGARAEAIDTRCMVNGGIAVCTEPVIVPSPPVINFDRDMWKYNLCDMNGPSLPRDKAWCEAFGGIFGANGCTGGQLATGGNVVGIASRFEQIINNACSMTMASGGWGETMSYNVLCWNGGSVVQNGITTRNLMKMSFSGYSASATGCNSPWTGVVVAAQGRTLACPAGYFTRTKTNGDLECWKLVPECAKVGNPINLLDGCKLQREVDYRSRSPGGIEVERYYNSGGYFRFGPALQQSSDVWRTTWDRRLLVPSGAGNVLAYAQRPDGLLHVFRADGTEMLNTAGGGSAILARLTDGAAAATGWRLTTADKDIELYDVSGRLQSLTRRTGWTYGLAYDGSGRLKSVTDALGGVVSLTYDTSDRLSGFVAPGNRTYRYGYDDIGRLTTVTYPDNTVRTYHYENPAFLHGLTGITDENGVRFATWSYDAIGRAITSQHAGGAEAVTLGYGVYSPTANEGTTGTVDAFGTERTYIYQVAGGLRRIKRITQPCPGCAGGIATYTFDVNGNLASSTDFAGNKTLYAFDLSRNLEISRTEAAGTSLARTITTQWHPMYRLPTRITAPSGVVGVSEVTDFNYDPQENLLQRTVTAGMIMRQWTNTYNARGQVLTADGPRTDVADITTYTYYDATDPCAFCRGNLRTVANALGHLTTYNDYDADGQPTRTTDPNGVVTTSSYDARGRLRTRTVNAGNPTAETTTFDYDGVGQLTRTTMPDGAFLRYQYDDAHRLTELSDSQGNVTQYTLDAMGNPIKEDVFDPADRNAKSRRRTYDALNRLFSEIGAAGQTSTYQYDGNGNMTGNTDPLGRSTAFGRDALNRLITATDAAAGVTRYGYDARDRLVSVRDPINLTTSYSYDGLGNLTQTASPDTGVSTYVPDAQRNVVASTDARGQLTSFTYDALNRQVLATYVGATVTLDYDNTATGGTFARGRLTRITDPSGTTVYTYDPFGRVLSKAQTVSIDASSKSFSVGYQYAAGRATGITYPSGRNVSYGFDAQGRINSVAVAGQPVLSGVVYFPFGGLQAWTWANGQPYRRAFDADGRIVTVTLGPDIGTYSNDSWTFGYDGLNRLTSAVLPQGESLGYTYDANGNRKLETRVSAATNYGYAIGSNRLQSLSGATVKSFTYDATGNLTGNGNATFAYDGRGRLAQSSGGYRYLINGLGQRVGKIGPGVVTGANYYVYDEQGHLIGEYDATGAARQELIYLGDTPIASVRSKASGGFDIFAIYSDHLDTPRLVTNQANQNVWEWKVDTFGAGAANENPSGLGTFSFNLRFPGQYYDAETGLHYNYFRDYDPAIGRYEQSDPIGLKGGLNTYGYVDGAPHSKKDAFGLATYVCRQPLDACGNTGKQRCFADIPGNPFYHQYLCVIEPNGNITCGSQDPTGNPFSSPGKPSEDHYPFNRPDMCRKVDPRECVDKCVQKRIRSPERPRYGIPFGTDCQEWSNDVVLQCQNECKNQ